METSQRTSDDGKAMSPLIVHGALSDIGKVRAENQDAFIVDAGMGLYVVSDGMGGGQAGALASQIVVKVLPELLRNQEGTLKHGTARKVRGVLSGCVAKLSQELHRKSEGQPGLSGMGATVVAVLVRSGSAHVVHMGDSRAYLLRKGKLKQLTDDHSVVGLLLREGEITPEEAKRHPARGHLSRYVGMPTEVDADVRTVRLKEGDCILLCTDGLTGLVSDSEIKIILNTAQDLRESCKRLVDAANAAGGKDNITVMVLRYVAAKDLDKQSGKGQHGRHE